jgi:hypothetical protein
MEFYLYAKNKYTTKQFEKAKIFLSKRYFMLQKTAFKSDFYILLNTNQETGTYTNLEIMFDKIQIDFPTSNYEFEILEKLGYSKQFFKDTFSELIKIFEPENWNNAQGDRIEFVSQYKELMFIDFKENK